MAIFSKRSLLTRLARLGVVVECNADGSAMVPIVLANDLLATDLPQPRIMVGAGGNKICRVSAEGAIPYPALMSSQGRFEWEWLGLLIGARFYVHHLPDLGCMVRTACGELLDVGR